MQRRSGPTLVAGGRGVPSTADVHGAKPSPSAGTIDYSTLSLVSEFLTTALFIVVTTSMVGVRARGRTLSFTGDISAYLPQRPEIYSALSSSDPDAFFDRQLSGHLRHIYQQAAFARQLLPTATESWLGSKAADPVNWSALHLAWQPLCGEVRMLLLTLIELDMLRGSDQVPRLLEIEALTKAARYGGTPCIRSDGAVFVHGWLDARRERRIPVGVSIHVDCGDGRQRAYLTDISTTGAGLSLCGSLASGTSLSIELPNSRRWSGTVVWCHGGNVGMRFDKELSGNDPVFQNILSLRRLACMNEGD